MLCNPDVSIKKIADKFNVSYSTISGIRNGSVWKHVLPDLKLQRAHNTVTTKIEQKIIKLISSNEYTLQYISDNTGVSITTINNIITKYNINRERMGKKLSPKNRKQIKQLLKQKPKLTHKEIADIFNVCPSTISKLIKRYGWKV